MKKLLFILFLLIGSLSYGQTIFTQTYVDRCTGDVKVVVANFQNGSATVAFYNKVRTFTYNEFLSGELQQWLLETYEWWQQLSPCSTATAETQQAQQVAQNAAQAAQSASTAASSAATSATSSVPPPSTNTTNTNATTNTNTSSSSTSNTSGNTTSGNESSSGGTSSGGTEGGTSSGGNTSEGSSNEGGQTTESKGEDTSTETKSETKSESDGGGSDENKETESKETESTEENKEESKEEVKEEEKKEEESKEESEEESSEEESDEESSEEKEEEKKEEKKEKKEKKQSKMLPIQLRSDLMANQALLGNYDIVTSIGATQSSIFGDESYGATAMIWSNLRQFSLNGSYTKVHMEQFNVSTLNHDGHTHYSKTSNVSVKDPIEPPTPKLTHITSASVGYMNNFGNGAVMMNMMKIKPTKHGTFGAGINMGNMFGENTYQMTMVGYNVLYTNQVMLNPRINYAPAFIWTQTPFVTRVEWERDEWGKSRLTAPNQMRGQRIHGMMILANSFTVQLTRRFSMNMGATFIKSTDPNIPLIKSFMIGAKLPF
jgi:hypothetical protein